jgi:hypothetical protein
MKAARQVFGGKLQHRLGLCRKMYAGGKAQ